jgi:hypothetical protein
MENQIVEQKPNPKIEKIFKGFFWFLVVVPVFLVLIMFLASFLDYINPPTPTLPVPLDCTAPHCSQIQVDYIETLPEQLGDLVKVSVPLFMLFLLVVFLVNLILLFVGKFKIYRKHIKKLLITSFVFLFLFVMMWVITAWLQSFRPVTPPCCVVF